MICFYCGSAKNNSVHKRKTQYGYHEFVEIAEVDEEPTLEERIATLENEIAAIKAKVWPLKSRNE